MRSILITIMLGVAMPFIPLTTSNSNDTNLNALNTMLRELYAEQEVKIIKDGTGTRRILLGKGVDDFYGLKVSQSGTDVFTADDSDLVFNSDNNVFKIVDSGTYRTTTTYTTPSPGAGTFGTQSFTIATIPHGLSYTPAVIGYTNNVGVTYHPLPLSDYSTTGSAAYWYTFSITTNSTDVIIVLNTMVYAGSFFLSPGVSFRYYLLQETAD